MAPMAEYSPRSSYESDSVLWSKAAARRALSKSIGQELGAHYQVPRDLSHEILTLLMRLGARKDEK
jgi:hypothetical protein